MLKVLDKYKKKTSGWVVQKQLCKKLWLFINVTYNVDEVYEAVRARIFKLLRAPRIDSKEPIPPDCVAWRAGTTTLFLLDS